MPGSPRAGFYRLEFGFAAPPYVDAFVDVFGVRPTFDAPANLSTFDAAYLGQPLPQANEQGTVPRTSQPSPASST